MPVYPAPSSLDSHLAIRVENLGKKYRIGAIHEKNKTFGEVLNKAARGPLRLARRMQQREKASSNSHSIFWALRNVSFEVARGQVVGIIGRNGAGKSTLLKLLSRIVTPDEGYAQIRGRMGSLLEVGTGFHFELTGRENIYLSGAIRGMRRQEIDHKFDEIVDFSGVEQFIDTPVKHYSSGMYLRLAFAVAAHLESEVLLVDEVLAVGDAEFQKKCLGKMGDVSQQGRTVLMVSHNMESIQHLCNQVIVLEKGQVYMIGSTQDGIASYLSMFSTAAEGNVDLSEHSNRSRGSIPILRNIRLLDQSGLPKNQFMSGEMLKIELTCDFPKDMSQPQLGIGFDDWLGTRIFSLRTQTSGTPLIPTTNPCKVFCQLGELPLVPGRYTLSLSAGRQHQSLADSIERAISLEVVAGDFFGNGKLPQATLGRVLIRSDWSLESDSQTELSS